MLTSVKLNIAEKLKNKTYRDSFFATKLQDEIATQIHELREHRSFTQGKLAEQCGMKQSAISRIEQADYSSWSYKTLLRVAQALDAQLKILLIPYEKVIEEYKIQEDVTTDNPLFTKTIFFEQGNIQNSYSPRQNEHKQYYPFTSKDRQIEKITPFNNRITNASYANN